MTIQDLDKIYNILNTRRSLLEAREAAINSEKCFCIIPRLERHISSDVNEVIKSIILIDIDCQIKKCDKQLKVLGVETEDNLS